MEPYPLLIDAGQGAWVLDADGNRMADFHAGFGVMVSGHGHRLITQAIRQRAGRGTHFGTLTDEAIRLAEELTARFGMDAVQMTNSGTEATQLAIRIARAATGRDPILKIEGSYHGAHDPVMVSTHPSLREAGPDRAPVAVPWGRGVPQATLALTHVIPFNDAAAAEAAIAEVRPACLILEPILLNTGFIAPAAGYHERLREICDRYQVVLIHDEVKTGLTIGYGGARVCHGLAPDLLCLGKGIGGGLPAGAVLGDADLMHSVAAGDAPHYSTFAANPLTAAAGLAALTQVMTPQAHTDIAALNARLIDGVSRELLRHPAIRGYAIGEGAKGTVVFSRSPLRTYRDWETRIDHDLGFLYWICLMNDGILLSPGQDEQWTLSVAHTDRETDLFLNAFRRFCALAAPALEAEE